MSEIVFKMRGIDSFSKIVSEMWTEMVETKWEWGLKWGEWNENEWNDDTEMNEMEWKKNEWDEGVTLILVLNLL